MLNPADLGYTDEEFAIILDAAELEDRRRREGRKNVLAFTEYTKPGYCVGPPHRLIARKLMRVYNGQCKRLMIFAPPRTGKSEISTRRFPAFYIGTRPDKQIITASANAGLARDFGRDVRNIIDSPEFANLLPNVELAADSRAADRWNTSQGGIYVSAPIGGSIVGRGADCLLIDDPIKDREAANSKAVRESVWSWYTSVARPRLMPGGSIIIVNTRWHEDDLCGRLLEAAKEEDGEQWEVVSIAAIADQEAIDMGDPLRRKLGEAAWPTHFPVTDLMATKKAIGIVEWNAQYQQRPKTAEGVLFQTSKLIIVPAVPPDDPIVAECRAWDIAATEEVGTRNPDWTAGVRIARLKSGRYIILNARRIRAEPYGMEKFIQKTAREDGGAVAIELPQDPGAAGKAYVRYLVSTLAGYIVSFLPQTGSKETRAAALASQITAGNVLMIAGAWNEEFTDELAGFPAGRHDDQVDAAASAFNKVALKPPPPSVRFINFMGR